MENQGIYNTALKIVKTSTLSYKDLGINLTICKKIANYAVSHPNKQYMIMCTPTLSGLDPMIDIIGDGKRIKRIFKYLSLYTFLLVGNSRDEWIFYYKLVNNKSEKIIINKHNSDKKYITINSAVNKALFILYNKRELDSKEPELIETDR